MELMLVLMWTLMLLLLLALSWHSCWHSYGTLVDTLVDLLSSSAWTLVGTPAGTPAGVDAVFWRLAVGPYCDDRNRTKNAAGRLSPSVLLRVIQAVDSSIGSVSATAAKRQRRCCVCVQWQCDQRARCGAHVCIRMPKPPRLQASRTGTQQTSSVRTPYSVQDETHRQHHITQPLLLPLAQWPAAANNALSSVVSRQSSHLLAFERTPACSHPRRQWAADLHHQRNPSTRANAGIRSAGVHRRAMSQMRLLTLPCRGDIMIINAYMPCRSVLAIHGRKPNPPRFR